jgi:hypothetical protein
MGCSNREGTNDDVGSIGFALQLAPGITVNTVSWRIDNSAIGFTRSGSVNVQFSNTVAFQVGGLPSATGYTVTLTALSTDGSLLCRGSATFDVVARTTARANVLLNCSGAGVDAGSVIVVGTTQVCANIDFISVAPLETTVNNPIALSAGASAGSVTPTFAWTASAGTFDNPVSASPTFTCPATPGDVTITLTVSPSAPTCNTTTTQTVTVTCDVLIPTFTNVYANVISRRCTGCHHPGGSGVTVGMLDMSTLAVAYASLVGVPAMGIGAGASGITCASAMPPLARVSPNDSAHSLLFDKVNSKLQGTNAPCGSPMPLPASGVPLTQAQVNLIAAWIDAGALNN